jgi:hypothetical protein
VEGGHGPGGGPGVEAAGRERAAALGPEDLARRGPEELHAHAAAGKARPDRIPHDPVAAEDLPDDLPFGKAQEPGLVGQGEAAEGEAFAAGEIDHLGGAPEEGLALDEGEERFGGPDRPDAGEP